MSCTEPGRSTAFGLDFTSLPKSVVKLPVSRGANSKVPSSLGTGTMPGVVAASAAVTQVAFTALQPATATAVLLSRLRRDIVSVIWFSVRSSADRRPSGAHLGGGGEPVGAQVESFGQVAETEGVGGPDRGVAAAAVQVPALAVAGVPHGARQAGVEPPVVGDLRLRSYLHADQAPPVHLLQRVEHIGDLRLDHHRLRRVPE